ncbi:hypothetical protein FHW17_003515 [Phyllobacterium sp. P30BS-XVII]|nr:hypothetical protein [Phyllobacterium sp. P30BS-XVII]
MIFFRHLYDGFNDVWEAAATAAALLHGMVDFCRDNQLPRVNIEKFNNSILDLFLGNDIAMTYKHIVYAPYLEE